VAKRQGEGRRWKVEGRRLKVEGGRRKVEGGKLCVIIQNLERLNWLMRSLFWFKIQSKVIETEKVLNGLIRALRSD